MYRPLAAGAALAGVVTAGVTLVDVGCARGGAGSLAETTLTMIPASAATQTAPAPARTRLRVERHQEALSAGFSVGEDSLSPGTLRACGSSGFITPPGRTAAVTYSAT